MNKLTQLGKNTPLWRRVQRHTHMSAIFAPPTNTAVSQPTPYAPPRSAMTLSTTAASVPDMSDPLSTAVDPTPILPSPKPPQSKPTIPDTLPAQPGLQRKESPVTAVPTPSPTAPDSRQPDDEANWRRLQTIMQRHRQKQTGENVAETIQQQDDAPAAAPDAPRPAEEPALTVQKVPLEAAWPVQKNPPTEQDVPEQPQLPAQQPTAQRQSLPSAEATQINQNLAQVAPGRRTASPIETILPSRPRPQPQSQNVTEQEPLPTKPAPLNAPQPVPQPERATAVSPTHHPKLIQTEIGPLPADLWETLGETPPAAALPGPEVSAKEQEAILPSDPTPSAAAVARKETTASVSSAIEPPITTPEQTDLPNTAVPPTQIASLLQPKATPRPGTIMAKPVNHPISSPPPTEGHEATAVSQPNNESSPLAAATQPQPITIEMPADAPSQANIHIQRQLVETAVPPPTPFQSKAGSRTVNIKSDWETIASPKVGQVSSPNQAKSSATAPLIPTAADEKPTAKIQAQSTTTPPIQLARPVVAPVQTVVATPAQIQRQSAQTQPEAVIQQLPTMLDTTQMMETAVTPPSYIQRQPAQTQPEAVIQRLPTVPNPPQMIETAAAPPSRIQGQPTQVQPETAIQRLPTVPDMTQIMETAVTATGLPTITPDLDTAIPTEKSPAEAEAESAPEDDLDIDALSRQVYQAIKRKLAVEWERGYGR